MVTVNTKPITAIIYYFPAHWFPTVLEVFKILANSCGSEEGLMKCQKASPMTSFVKIKIGNKTSGQRTFFVFVMSLPDRNPCIKSSVPF